MDDIEHRISRLVASVREILLSEKARREPRVVLKFIREQLNNIPEPTRSHVFDTLDEELPIREGKLSWHWANSRWDFLRRSPAAWN